MESVFDIMDMDDEERSALLQLTDAQMAVSIPIDICSSTVNIITKGLLAGCGPFLQSLPKHRLEL